MLVAALGYFVDVYDLLLFSILRVKSLTALGVPPDRILDVGTRLIQMQVTGLLLGGIAWGILADNYGRRSVLFGSILLNSLANVANGLVPTVDQYAWLRLIAGIGLAGELGAGITLVAKLMSREGRGYGTTIVASLGLVGDLFAWRTAFFIGGALGFALLALRSGVTESTMFEAVKVTKVAKGNFLILFSSPRRLLRYLAVVFVGLPTWFVMGILITFSGDLISGFASQWLRSRKRAILLFLILCALGVVNYFLMAREASAQQFYVACLILGAASGYWAVFVTVASEQFGTNLGATVASTAPNFVRGGVAITIAFVSLLGLEETYGKNLDYVEG